MFTIQIPVTLERLDELTLEHLSCSSRMLTQARDYVYQERVGPLIRDSGAERLGGRICGYQGRYVARVEKRPTMIELSCSCGASRLCAHVVAVVVGYRQHPWRALEWRRIMVWPSDSRWQWMMEVEFPWEAIRYPDPVLLQPTYEGAPWPRNLPWSASNLAVRHRDLLSQLPLVHASWWSSEAFCHRLAEQWADSGLVAMALGNLTRWLEIAYRAPEVPLNSLWKNAATTLESHVSVIQRLLWSVDPKDPWAGRQVETFLELLEVAWGASKVSWLTDLREQFAWADPDGIETALFFHRLGDTRQAVATLEAHMPQEKHRRESFRIRLMAWTTGRERLGHQVADFLENPTEEKRHALFDGLTVQARIELMRAFPSLGVEPD